MSDVKLNYDVLNYIIENGGIPDILRLVAAGYNVPEAMKEQVITDLETILNDDGGVPFDLEAGNPSSVKETSEILILLANQNGQHKSLIDKMTRFLISRQKKDGGFSETLNLDSFIEDRWGASTGREWYPVGTAITWLTAKSLEALCRIKYEDEDRVRRARAFLLNSQHECGHWPDFEGQDESDPLATGNILCALRQAGVSEDHKAFIDGRAALLQHLKDSLENGTPYDMVDLIAVGEPTTELEVEVIGMGLKLVVQTQNEDGGWSQMGLEKSDPELSSLLGSILMICDSY